MGENDIIFEDSGTSTIEFIEISNKGVGTYDEFGNLLVIKESNPEEPNGTQYEVISNKVSGFTNPNNITYPTTLAVVTLINQYGDKYVRYTQNTPSNVWVVVHNMGKRPAVVVTDSAGTTVEGQITYNDTNSLTIEFSVAFSGFAELN